MSAAPTLASSNTSSPPASAWANWRNTVLLALAVAVFRVIYLAWFCPYELVFDEAQYWDWSRRLDLSYYTKGPGIAWAIAASTRLLGDSEWAVRLPAVIASFIGTLAIARLAMVVVQPSLPKPGGAEAVGFFAAVAFMLIPVYQAVGLLMTIDGPYVTCWILALWAGWAVIRRLEERRPSSLPAWLALATALGAGFLFKYTILLLIPTFLAYFALRRNSLRWSRPAVLHLLLALVLFVLVISPVLIWNQQHGWPTVRHLLGHLDVPGGDVVVTKKPWYGPVIWPLEYLGGQIGAVGPMVILMALMVHQAVATRWSQGGLWPGRLFMILSALPILAFYLTVSFINRVQVNWPIAGYAGLLALVAQGAVIELPRYANLVRQWKALPRPRPRRGFLRKRPETPFQMLWHFAVGFGAVAGIIMLILMPLARLPVIGAVIPVERLTGWRAYAQLVHAEAQKVRRDTGQEPWIAADSYGITAALAFYLPVNADRQHQVVYNAASRVGRRPNSYDYFADTDLTDARLHGRPALIVDGASARWSGAFKFKSIKEVLALRPVRSLDTNQPKERQVAARVFLATGYQGPRDGQGARP
ncbi:MAG: glycosyltransferase family 39 protein [Phycisphaeraceae bacterium]